MSWLGSGWNVRIPVIVRGVASAGTGDIQITVPVDCGLFWSNVASTGADIRITAADGVTTQTYQRSSWTYASKIAVLQVDNFSFPAAGDCLLWVYVGNSSAADAAGSFTAATPATGYIQSGRQQEAYTITPGAEAVGSTRARRVIQMPASDEIHLWVDYSSILERQDFAYEGRDLLEEISYVEAVDVLRGGAPSAGLTDEASEIYAFEQGIRVHLHSGVNGEAYTVGVRVVTTTKRSLTGYAEIRVQNATEQ